jgi:hypothetical protein
VLRNGTTIEYREAAIDTVLRVGKGIDALRPEAESEVRRQRLERAVDKVLADSFPASDPPSWTLGIARPQPKRQATTDAPVPRNGSRAAVVREDVIDVSRPATAGRTFLKGLVSLAGAAGIALLVPFAILLIGMPIALAVRGVIEAARWLLAVLFGYGV